MLAIFPAHLRHLLHQQQRQRNVMDGGLGRQPDNVAQAADARMPGGDFRDGELAKVADQMEHNLRVKWTCKNIF